ncbi:MAG: putative 5' nucleotidase family protein [Streblomastix strix]|uniref:Putative 5' nucleotidase family protein n=1 Tax=Streblomastix strix TaxID=222440 RepID=A0A5J4VIN7_9EUKA|nr:MAG: putative 5' nucleotidase family protein [Streblomastix strix]
MIILVILILASHNIFAVLDFTLLHTTDIHGWIGGHEHQLDLDADLGDLYNLIYHMKTDQTSDKIGTGLSDGTPIQGEFIFEEVKKLPYDGLCIGNHELGTKEEINYIADNFTPYWNGTFVSANVEHKDKSKNLADKFFSLPLPKGQGRVVILGFLYNMSNAASNVIVHTVSETLKQPFMDEALKDGEKEQKIRLVVALCHIATPDDEVLQIRAAVRQKLPNVPLVLLTAHSHQERIKDYGSDKEILDPFSYAMESGCYSHKVGQLLVKIDDQTDNSDTLPSFTHKFVTASKIQLQKLAGFIDGQKKLDSGDIIYWDTPTSKQIQADIANKYEQLNLSLKLGCSPFHFKRRPNSTEIKEGKGLYQLVIDKIIKNKGSFRQWINNQQSKSNNINKRSRINDVVVPTVAVLGKSSLRYDIYEGRLTSNDIFTVDPFDNYFALFEDVDGQDMRILMGIDKISGKQYRNGAFDDINDGNEYKNMKIDHNEYSGWRDEEHRYEIRQQGQQYLEQKDQLIENEKISQHHAFPYSHRKPTLSVGIKYDLLASTYDCNKLQV